MVVCEEKVLGTLGNLMLLEHKQEKLAVLVTKGSKTQVTGVQFAPDLFIGGGSNIKCIVRAVGKGKVLVLVKCAKLCGLDYSNADGQVDIRARLWLLEHAFEPLEQAHFAFALPDAYIEAPKKTAKLAKEGGVKKLWLSRDTGPDNYVVHTKHGDTLPALVPSLKLSKQLRSEFEGKSKGFKCLYECKLHAVFEKWIPIRAVPS